MSLNGLDNAQVKEAHDAAVAEAGGWYVCSFTHAHTFARRYKSCASVCRGAFVPSSDY